jgi:hypothetical protein
LIDFGNGVHKVIIGMTGTGKTYTATNELRKVSQGVLFFNTMNVPMKGFTKCTGANDLPDIMDMLEQGEKINFMANNSLVNARKQLIAIINGLYSRVWSDFIFVIDEVHLYTKEAREAVLRAITTGRNQGVEMVGISQRLALVDNTIFTQSPYKVLFLLENETEYCERYGIPYTEIESKIKAKDPGGMVGKKYQPPHAYCTYFMGRVEGAYKYGG